MVNLGQAEVALDGVRDPEIPDLSIVDLGLVRKVTVEESAVRVEITPTYSGCPAMETIREDMREALTAAGFSTVEIVTDLSRPWTTDWISRRGRLRLLEAGIAPPPMSREHPRSACPHCGSENTKTVSEFGSTACKSLMACRCCSEPFDRFKVLEP